MTIQETTRVVPAGWYEDPADPGKVRWWNGLSWTEHVEVKPAYAMFGWNREGESGTEQRIAEARELERQHGISTGESAVITRRASMALDARGPSTGTIPIQGLAVPRRTIRTTTTSAWLLAVTPVLALVLAVVAGYAFFYLNSIPLAAIVAGVVYLLGLLWAILDSRALVNRGLNPPTPLLALALPVVGPLLYLIVRRRAIPGGTPLIAFLVLLALAVGLPLGVVASGGASGLTKALDVQRAVSADLMGSGAATSVSCPPILESTTTGSVFTCDAVLPSGDAVHVWVSFDDESGQFSWALANR